MVLCISVYVLCLPYWYIGGISVRDTAISILEFCATLPIFYFVLRGRRWAVSVATGLLLMGIITGLITLYTMDAIMVARMSVLLLVCIYSYALCFLRYSKCFKAYSRQP